MDALVSWESMKKGRPNQSLVTAADLSILHWLTPEDFTRQRENLQSAKS